MSNHQQNNLIQPYEHMAHSMQRQPVQYATNPQMPVVIPFTSQHDYYYPCLSPYNSNQLMGFDNRQLLQNPRPDPKMHHIPQNSTQTQAVPNPSSSQNSSSIVQSSKSREKKLLFEISPSSIQQVDGSKIPPTTETTRVSDEPKPDQASETKNLLFDINDEQGTRDGEKQVSDLPSRDPSPPKQKTREEEFNDSIAAGFQKFHVQYKPESRFHYTKQEMEAIMHHPYTTRKTKETSENDICRNIMIGKYKNNYKPKMPGLQFDLETKLETVDKRFVPEHLKNKQNAMTSDEKLLKDLKVVLNRLMENNIEDSLKEIESLDVTSLQNQPILANALFEMAIKQTKFSKAFALLTSHFWSLDNFKRRILEMLQSSIKKSLGAHLKEANISVDKQLEKENDPTTKKIFMERRETVLSKAEEAYYGTMTFMAELYTVGKFSDEKLIQTIKEFIDDLGPENTKSIITILTIAGKQLDSKEKKKMDQLYKSLDAKIKRVQLSSYQMYHIDQLFKKRAEGWLDQDSQKSTTGQSKTIDLRKIPTPLQGSSNSLMNINTSNLSQQFETLKPNKCSWNEGCQSGAHSKALGRKTQPHQMPADNSNRSGLLSQEEYDKELGKIHGDPVGIFASQDNKYIEDFASSYKPAFVHYVVELVLNKKLEQRLNAGKMFIDLMKQQTSPLIPDHMIHGFKQFAKAALDFLEDCPKMFQYIAEILHCFLVSDITDCAFILPIIHELGAKTTKHQAVECLLNTIQIGIKEAPQGKEPSDVLVAKKLGSNIRNFIVQNMNLPAPETDKLCQEYSCSFILDSSYSMNRQTPSSTDQGPRHSMPPGINGSQNGTRSSALPPNSTWGSPHLQSQQPIRIAQRQSQPPQPPGPTITPTQHQSDEGWLQARKKNKGRNQAVRNSQHVPGSTSTGKDNDILSLFDRRNPYPTPADFADKLKQNHGNHDLLSPFTVRLFKFIHSMRKEEMEKYVELLTHFQMSRQDTQVKILHELDHFEYKITDDQRSSLLTCLLTQNVISQEALKKYQASGRSNSPLMSIIKKLIG